MARFFDLLERSVIVQSLLPLMFGGTICYMSIAGQATPALLEYLALLSISFWMGSKLQHAVDANRLNKGRGRVHDLRQE